jgi:hypothetical protein
VATGTAWQAGMESGTVDGMRLTKFSAKSNLIDYRFARAGEFTAERLTWAALEVDSFQPASQTRNNLLENSREQ